MSKRHVSDPKLAQIHQATIRVLRKTGMRFLHPKAVELFQENGFRTAGDVVYFTEEQLMHYVSMAPEKFTIYARNPKYNVEVGGDTSYFLCATGPALVGDRNGKTHTATVKDLIQFVKFYEQNPDYLFNGGDIVQPQEIDPRHRMTTSGFLALLHTEKALEIDCIEDAAAGTADGEEMMKLLQIAFNISEEELKAKPRCITITDTNSPLLFDRKMLDMLFVCAKYRQPIAISACSMAGTTGPVTLAGNLVVTNAEVLAGIALAQMISPGCPVLYGCQSTVADPRSGRISVGCAEAALTYATSAKLAKMYGLPSRGGGALTDATCLSVQAGYESMLTLLSTYGAHTNLIFPSSGIMKSYAYASPEKLMVDFDIVAMVKRFFEGFRIDEDALAVDVINEVGISGEFLTTDHTLENMREELTVPDIGLCGVTSEQYWDEFNARINKKMQRMLDSYSRPKLDVETVECMKNYMLKIGVSEALLRTIMEED